MNKMSQRHSTTSSTDGDDSSEQDFIIPPIDDSVVEQRSGDPSSSRAVSQSSSLPPKPSKSRSQGRSKSIDHGTQVFSERRTERRRKSEQGNLPDSSTSSQLVQIASQGLRFAGKLAGVSSKVGHAESAYQQKMLQIIAKSRVKPIKLIRFQKCIQAQDNINVAGQSGETPLIYFLKVIAPSLKQAQDVFNVLQYFQAENADFTLADDNAIQPVFYLAAIFNFFDLFTAEYSVLRRSLLGLFGCDANQQYIDTNILAEFVKQIIASSTQQKSHFSVLHWQGLLSELVTDTQWRLQLPLGQQVLALLLTASYQGTVREVSLNAIEALLQYDFVPFAVSAGTDNLFIHLFEQWQRLYLLNDVNADKQSDLMAKTLHCLTQIVRHCCRYNQADMPRYGDLQHLLLVNTRVSAYLNSDSCERFISVLLCNVEAFQTDESNSAKASSESGSSRRRHLKLPAVALLAAHAVNKLPDVKKRALYHGCFKHYQQYGEILCLRYDFNIDLYKLLVRRYPERENKIKVLIKHKRFEKIVGCISHAILSDALSLYIDLIPVADNDMQLNSLLSIGSHLSQSNGHATLLELSGHLKVYLKKEHKMPRTLLPLVDMFFRSVSHLPAKKIRQVAGKLWSHLTPKSTETPAYIDKIKQLTQAARQKYSRADVIQDEVDETVANADLARLTSFVSGLSSRRQFHINECEPISGCTLLTYLLKKHRSFLLLSNEQPVGATTLDSLIRAFTDIGADFNRPDEHSRLPLDYALDGDSEKNPSLRLTLMLMEAGADVCVKVNRNDPHCQTPLDKLLKFFSWGNFESSEAFPYCMKLIIDQRYCSQTRVLRASLLTTALVDAKPKLVMSLVALLSRVIPSDNRAQYQMLVDVLIKTKQLRALMNFLDNDINALTPHIKKMADCWDIKESVLKIIVDHGASVFFAEGVMTNLAVLAKKYHFEQLDFIIGPIYRILLCCKNANFDMQGTPVQHDFLMAVNNSLDALQQVNGISLIEKLLAYFAENAEQLTLDDLNRCLATVCQQKLSDRRSFDVLSSLLDDVFESDFKDVETFIRVVAPPNSSSSLNSQLIGENTAVMPAHDILLPTTSAKLSERLQPIGMSIEMFLNLFAQVNSEVSNLAAQADKSFSAIAKLFAGNIDSVDDTHNIAALLATIIVAVECSDFPGAKRIEPQQVILLILLASYCDRSQPIDPNIMAECHVNQGKSQVLAMTAAYGAFRGNTVSIASRNERIAQTQSQKYSSFFNLLGIPLLDTKLPSEAGVRYTTITELTNELLKQQMRFLKKVSEASPVCSGRRQILAVYQADTLFFDDVASTSSLVGVPVRDIEWVYQLLWAHRDTIAEEKIKAYYTEIKTNQKYATLDGTQRAFIEFSLSGWVASVNELTTSESTSSENKSSASADRASDSATVSRGIVGGGREQFLQIAGGLAITPQTTSLHFYACEAFIRSQFACCVGVTEPLCDSVESQALQEIYRVETFSLSVPPDRNDQLAKETIAFAGDDAEQIDRICRTAVAIVSGDKQQPCLIVVKNKSELVALERALRQHLSYRSVKPTVHIVSSNDVSDETLRPLLCQPDIIEAHNDVKSAAIILSTISDATGIDFARYNSTLVTTGIGVILSHFTDTKRLQAQVRNLALCGGSLSQFHCLLNMKKVKGQLVIIAKKMAQLSRQKTFSTKSYTAENVDVARAALLELCFYERSLSRERNTAIHNLCQQFYLDITTTGHFDTVTELNWCKFLHNMADSPLFHKTFTPDMIKKCLPFFPILRRADLQVIGQDRIAVLNFLYAHFRGENMKDLVADADLTTITTPVIKINLSGELQQVGLYAAGHSDDDDSVERTALARFSLSSSVGEVSFSDVFREITGDATDTNKPISDGKTHSQKHF